MEDEKAEANPGPIEYEENEEELVDEEGSEDSVIPLLFVDVNLGQDVSKRIVLYEGDDPEEVAFQFSTENSKISFPS